MKVFRRLQGLVQFDQAAIVTNQKLLDTDGCNQDGTARPSALGPVPPPFGAPVRPVFPPSPAQTTGPQQKCAADFNALRLAMQKKFTDRTAFTNAAQNIKVNRGVLRSTYRAALQAVASAKNTANIAAVNRPNQILAQKALVANAQSAVFSGQLAVKNTFVYAPSDGTVAGIAGTAGEFTAGGNNLTPTTPTIGGSGARIPTVGPLAAADQKNFTGGNQLSATNPTGGAFMQISDLNAFQVVAVYPEGDAVQITPGSLSKVTFDALPGKEYDGTVTPIAAIGIAGPNGAAQYYATVLLNNAPPEVRSGMAANVSVVVAPRQQLTA